MDRGYFLWVDLSLSALFESWRCLCVIPQVSCCLFPLATSDCWPHTDVATIFFHLKILIFCENRTMNSIPAPPSFAIRSIVLAFQHTTHTLSPNFHRRTASKWDFCIRTPLLFSLPCWMLINCVRAFCLLICYSHSAAVRGRRKYTVRDVQVVGVYSYFDQAHR